MGKIKHRDSVVDLFKKGPVVDISSLKKIIGENSGYTSLMLNKMVKQGRIYRVTRGKYSLSDDPVLAVFCFKPAYLGLQEALSIHNLWEQESNTVVLTTKTVREGPRKINGSMVLLKRIPVSLFFGIEYKRHGDFYLPVSDIEKTFLDLLYFGQPIDRDLFHQFKGRMDKKKVEGYLRRYGAAIKEKAGGLLNMRAPFAQGSPAKCKNIKKPRENRPRVGL